VIQSPELQMKIAHWRDKQSRGEMSPEDWIEAMTALREHRTGAQAASAASKARKAPVNTSALKDSLRALKKL